MNKVSSDIIIKTVLFLLFVTPNGCLYAKKLSFTYNRNVELIGIVYNIANNYSPKDDGIESSDSSIFRKIYVSHGDEISKHPAVSVMKEMLEQDLLNEDTYFELGLYFAESEFTRMSDCFKPNRKVFHVNGSFTNPLFEQFVTELDQLSKEPYMVEYFTNTYSADIRQLEYNSANIKAIIESMNTVIPQFMKESSERPIRVVPAIHIEPFVGYGPLIYDSAGNEVSLIMCGLNLDNNDNETTFGYTTVIFCHEALHPFVSRAVDSPDYISEVELLKELFLQNASAASRTADYNDWRSFFCETITRALEMVFYERSGKNAEYVSAKVNKDKVNFVFLEKAIAILKESFCDSDVPFYDFYPILVNKLATN